jgi:phage minor structural protein, N-terminal domain protein|nr:MAG TPA: tail protein [Caudoviricetes sp.]
MKLFLFNNDEKLIGTVSPLEGIQNEEINKIQTIECTVVYSELIEKASYIGHKNYSDNRIFHLYKIDHVTKTSTTDVKIVGVHTFFDDMESDGYVKDFRPTNRELVGVLTTILDGSRWQLGTVNIQRRYTGNFYYVTRKEALSKLIEATQIEIKPRLEFSRGKITGRYLDVFTRLGGRNGKVFVHGRDLLTVSEKKSQGAIYTAVVGRGKGEETDTGGYGRRITFKDVEWRKSSGNPVDKPVGQEYVEIPAMTKLYGFEKGTKPRIKIVEFQDEEDKEKLLRLSYEWLEKNSRMQVEYSAKVLNVGNLELGDTVGIFNPKLGIKYETRVFKVKRNLVDNKLTEFGIGDKVTTSPFSRTIELAKEMKNFQDDTVYWLDKIRERLSDKLINEDGYNYDLKADNEYKVPAGFYSFDKPIDQNPTKVVYMGAGKIAIANSKKPTGEWNWKTFLDGRGATLDLINTGVLRAGRIQSADGRSYWDLDTGEFHMEQSAINDAVKTVVNGKVQEIVGEVKKNLPTKEELKGKSSYLHKKYSDFADGRNMSDNSTLKYIGIYTGDKEQAPTNASEYSWTKIKSDGKLYKAYSNSLNGLDFTLVEPDENAKLFAKNRPRVNIVNNNDISDIWQANMFLSFKPNTKYTLTARAKGNSNKLWAYFRNNKTNAQFNWGQLEFRGLETKSITFTTTNDVDDVLFKFILVPEDENWTGIQIDWFTIYEGDKRYTDYPTNEPAQYHKYRYFGYVFKESTPAASDFEWFDLQQTSITNDKYTHIVYSDNADGSNFGREPKKYMGVTRTTSPTQPTDKIAYKWFKVKGEDGERGRDGVSNYIHRKYSDYSNGASMSDNSNLKYIGIYTGTSPTPPTTASSYLWSKIKGEDGANGVPGAKGADGRTPYFHTAYANSPTGDRDFSTTNSTGKEYIGTYSDFEVADSTDYRRYKWVKIKGENGANGRNGTDGHSLTANLRFEGKYINSVTTDVKVYLDVYYDGQKVDTGFDVQLKDKGGTRTDWSVFWNSNVNDGLLLINKNWKNGEQNGQPLELIALVTYKGLNTIANARMENVPDIVEIKEITKKYKTFDSTINQFNSTIGEVRYQTLANEENRNLIIGSRLLSDSEYNVFGKKWDGTSQVGIYTEIRQSTSNEIRFLYEGNTYLYVISEHNNKRVWQGIGFNLSVNKIRKGQQFTIKIPFYYLTNHENNEGIYAEIKNHKTGASLWRTRIDTVDIHSDTWDMRAYLFTADRDFETSEYSFWIYAVRNGGFCISTPYMCEGNKMFSKYSPAPEDVHLQNSRIESSIKQTKDEIDLKVSKDNVIAAINASVETTGEGPAQGVVKIDADKVDIRGALRAYKGYIGGFQIGTHEKDASKYWLTGTNQFYVGMSNGGGNWGQTALWVNWGTEWGSPGDNAWFVKEDGRMFCYNKAEFWNIPKINGGLSVTGNIFYGDDEKNPIGMWVYSPVYKKIYKKGEKWLYLEGIRSGEDWITIDSLASDRRIKTNIKESEVKALDVINKFKTYSFTRDYKNQVKDVQLGIMAQDVKEYMYDAFVENPDGIYSYEPFEMIPYLFKAIQELSTENQQLKSQLNEMNERLTKLEELINGNI